MSSSWRLSLPLSEWAPVWDPSVLSSSEGTVLSEAPGEAEGQEDQVDLRRCPGAPVDPRRCPGAPVDPRRFLALRLLPWVVAEVVEMEGTVEREEWGEMVVTVVEAAMEACLVATLAMEAMEVTVAWVETAATVETVVMVAVARVITTWLTTTAPTPSQLPLSARRQ